MLFHELRAYNFRGFLDTGTLKLGELNFFVGPNSAGKSSVLQIPLLLKQTFDDTNPENRLITDGRLVELGSFLDVVFKHDPKSSLSIEANLGESAFELLPYASLRRREARTQENLPVRFKLEFAATQRTGRIFIKSFSFYSSRGRELLSGAFSSLGQIKQWQTGVELPKRSVHLRFFHFIPSIYLTGAAVPQRIPPPAMSFLEALFSLRSIWDIALGSLIHLQPIRTPIKPVYRVTGESPISVGPTGENLLGVLYRDERRRKSTRKNLLTYLNYWLDRKFGLVKQVELEALTKGKTLYALSGIDCKTGTRVNLAAVGFGVSQIAPIIVQGFLSPANSCLLIEQPEIHLHPAAQAELGDLFIDFSDKGKQLFVETHSQYIIFRVLRRIAEGKLDASRVRIFFLSRSESGSKVKELEIQQGGRMPNWPPGFFEEGYEETAAIAEALVK